MVLYLTYENAAKLFTMMDFVFHIEPPREEMDEDIEKYCTNFSLFNKTKDSEPFKRFLPEFPKLYYGKNWSGSKQECVEHSMKRKKWKESEIVKECHVSSEELKEYIEINRIIEKLTERAGKIPQEWLARDVIQELIKNYKKRD